MKPHALTPSSLLVGIYVQDKRAVALGTLRTAGDELRTECVHHVGEPWQTLYNVLEEVDIIGAQNVVILTNCGELVQALSRPFTAPDGDATKKIKVKRGQYYLSGAPAHWQVLQWLGMHGGNWNIKQVDDLPKARELWAQQTWS